MHLRIYSIYWFTGKQSFLLVKIVRKIMKFFSDFFFYCCNFDGINFNSNIQSENEIHTYLERSVPFVGTDIPRIDGIDGTGIKIAIIDTGVDFNHPDLFGWGPDGKVVGGYNFIQRVNHQWTIMDMVHKLQESCC